MLRAISRIELSISPVPALTELTFAETSCAAVLAACAWLVALVTNPVTRCATSPSVVEEPLTVSMLRWIASRSRLSATPAASSERPTRPSSSVLVRWARRVRSPAAKPSATLASRPRDELNRRTTMNPAHADSARPVPRAMSTVWMAFPFSLLAALASRSMRALATPTMVWMSA